jgi:biopolymer transport protein ExbD
MAVKIEKGTALGTLSIMPLIDVVFLLLIFFLVASRFAEEERSIAVNLPDASEAQPLITRPKETIVNIKKNGDYLVNGSTVSAPRLDEILRQAAVDNPGRAVNIRSDENVPVKHLFYAINLCLKYRLPHSEVVRK